MNIKAKVSVIVNCYNSDTYLREAIESILIQTYNNLEVIFWDNQSTDKSAEIIKSFDDTRIKYFFAPQHTTLGIARNLAVKKSSSNWIAFLDADDLWDKNKLKLSMNAVEENENIGLIYNKSIVIDRSGNQISTVGTHISGYIHNELLRNGNFIVQSSMLVNKKIFEDVDGIDETLKFCPDYDLSLKITQKNKVVCVNQYLTYYRMHSNNITSTKNYENDIEVVKLLEKYAKKNKNSLILKSNILINNSYRLGSLFIKLILKKEYKQNYLVIKTHPLYLIFSPISFILTKTIKKLGKR